MLITKLVTQDRTGNVICRRRHQQQQKFGAVIKIRSIYWSKGHISIQETESGSTLNCSPKGTKKGSL